MDQHDAESLIRDAVPPGGTWADLGAGSGTFTRALAALVGADGVVHAVEPDAKARRILTRLSNENAHTGLATVIVTSGDFTQPFALPPLSGALMANSLHFATDVQQPDVLVRLASTLVPGGRIIVVEYDREQGNQWVPYPVSKRKFVALCQTAGLNAPTFMHNQPSAFGGSMYSAWTSLR